MKRFISILLTFILCFLCIETAFAAKKQIQFRKVPFGATVTEAEKLLKKDKISLYMFDASISAVAKTQSLVSANYYGFSFDNTYKVVTFGETSNINIKVAGYKPSVIDAYFVYLPVNGQIKLEDKYTSMYAAGYGFEPKNTNKMFDDLTKKLTDIYGKYSYYGGQEILEDLFGKADYIWLTTTPDEKFAIWEDSTAYLVLRSCDFGDNADNTFYKNAITLFYISKDADSLIDKAISVCKQNAIDEEADLYGNGDYDGL